MSFEAILKIFPKVLRTFKHIADVQLEQFRLEKNDGEESKMSVFTIGTFINFHLAQEGKLKPQN